ncbi:hypothetical protein [Rosettibacter firmus]|uniref:hypothetical protein n=1 Tax=Rosettibacter firmus TaxID=3111522 RepID=UPI00336BE817
MKLDWSQFLGKILNITMYENYGVVYGRSENEHPTFYEIVFKTGKLIAAYDDGLLLEAQREEQAYNIFVPFTSIKCVEIF